ncbi:MAG: DegT/DnrJ/EryC1/StrS family aminotransferase [Gelidibacter sp.]
MKVQNVICTTNGTLPLQIAIKTLDLRGEIITTPFSYVATTSSIVWEGCKPVFVDIHPGYLTIDETKIESAVTERTSAILATHVFGNPCEVETINKIAQKYNLKVIYDAAHAFNVIYKDQSIFSYGNISICSFHATKIFHTAEGGAMFTNDIDLYNRLFYHHNFGHKDIESFQGLGINAKMSELQAAMGLSVLPYFAQIVQARKAVVDLYNENLQYANLQLFKLRPLTKWNYSYYPVVFKDETQLLKVKLALESEQIFPRRYFYPVLNTLPYVNSKTCPIAERIANTILCLPLFVGMSKSDQVKIIEIILANV